MILSPKQLIFAEEYVIDFNATQAAIRAGYSPKTAASQGERLLRNVEIQKAIQSVMKKREKRTQITQDSVQQPGGELATADVNELVEYRRANCRYCHGVGHAYQWKDAGEHKRAVTNRPKGTPRPTCDGGFGFKESNAPHSECPACGGEGHGFPFVHDTRSLSPVARALYDGVKVTKEGLEVKTLDRQKALDNVARHLGMMSDKLVLQGDKSKPIEATITHRMPGLAEAIAAAQARVKGPK
jgi:phage terminase small subunit